MKKTLHFIHFIKEANKIIYLLLFLLFSTIGFAQTITPTKTVTVAPGVCGALDVELKIQGSNPVARPLEVVLVIDVSGSMGDGNNPKPLAYAQDAAIDFINKMFDPVNNPTTKNKVAIVTYSSLATIRQGLTLAAGKQDLINIINGLVANGNTNIQDGLVKAKKVLDGATYDCATARSIVLLTDGVANESGTNGNNCSGGQQGTCIQSAITAANAAKTVVVSGVTYNNQIFSVGLFGAISGTSQTDAEYALNQIQSGGSFFAENAANLTGIYTQIFTQLSWVAKQITGTPFEKETVDNNFIIGTITASKGTTTVTGQQIAWNIDFLNVETITLKYRLTPKPNTCGNQLVSTSRLDFQNALCATTFQNISSPTTNVPCPIITLNTQTNVTCFGGTNGAITLNTPTGGQSPYTYKWTKNNVDFATTKDISGLGFGTYKVTATDTNGCATGILTVEITQPSAALALAVSTKTDASCFGQSSGSVTAGAVTNAVGTVTYSWKNSLNIEVGTTASVSGLPSGTYTLTVTDSCSSKTDTVTIGQPGAALALTLGSKTDVSCFGESTGSVIAGTVTNAVGIVTYSWKNSANVEVGTSATVSGLPSGTYTLTVTDSCSSKTDTVTIGQPSAPLALTAGSKTDVSCFGQNTGSVTAGVVTNAVGTLTYSWKNSLNAEVGTSATVTGLPSGTYTLTVTDSCSSKTDTVTIGQPEQALSCSIIQDKAVTANGLSNGEATVTPVGGNGNYTYTWDNGETSAKAVGLNAGSHSVTVTDAKGCTTNCSVTITQPDILSCSITQDDPAKCYGDSNGKATVTPVGGNGEYTYAWDNGETASQAVGLNAGLHTVIVTDKLGYTTTCNVTIGQPEQALSCSIIQDKAVTANGLSNGEATVTPTGGNGNYTYVWDNGETSAKAVGLNFGSHSVTVTDAKGCTSTCSITITQPDVLSCSVTQDDPAKCYGDSNGKATVTPVGGNGEYTYSWDNGEIAAQAVGLNVGLHTVTVTDKLGYTTTCNVTIGQPEQALSCSIIQDKAVTANGLSNGEATVTPVGGNGNYTYAWDNGETSAKAVGLNAGLHSVTVTDAKGCTSTCSITITQPDVLSCSVTQDDPAKCYGDSNGKATVTPVGGNGEYTYAWDNGEIAAQAVGLNSGLHTVTVTDKLGYTTTCNITINQPEQALSCSVIQDKAVTANGLSNGEATVTPIGGNGNYTFVWDNGETTAKAIALSAGSHSVTVTDAKGCTSTCSINITQPDVLSCSVTPDDPAKCYGDSNGKATVTPVGGNGDYTYAWDNGETTAQAVGLNSGLHTVTVTDKLGYTTTCNVNIGQPEQALSCSIIQDKAVTANGLSNGEATVTPVGGNGNYTYAWDNGETSAKAIALSAGSHSVTVTDSKGCTSTCSVTIKQPDVLSCSITQDDPAKCYGDSNGKATVTPVGGNGEYTYAWDNGEITSQAVGLNFGLHTVTVTDKLGYTTTCNVTISQPEQTLSCSIVQDKAVTANGLSNGEATVTPIGGNGNYTYAWDNGETSAKAISLSAGSHSVTVTDAKGCTSTCSITITQPDILSCSVIQDDPAKCYGDSNGKATVTPVGGNGEYTYAWDNGETASQAVSLNAGVHIVTVTDKLGYTTTCNVTIGQPEQPLSCSVIHDKAVTANGLSNGEATVTPTGGNGNYTYAWDNGETSAKAIALSAGSHSVIVTDSKGCTSTCSITITEPDVLSCSVTQDDPAKCYGDSNGKATVTPVGGNGEYTYAWDNGETASQAVSLNAGVHIVTVTDKLGYTTTCNVTIGQPEQPLSCSIIHDKAVTANGLSNGEATVTPTGGNGNYTYAWDNGETSAKAIALSAGSHSVIVTDSKGCTSTCSITITEPDVLSCSVTQDDPAKCYGDSNGKATVTPFGGNGEYTYAWDNGETSAKAVGLNSGLHTVTVTDKLGYTTTCNVTINQPEQALSCSIIQDKAVTANGLSNGEATVTPTGGNGNYTYAWDNGETSAKAILLSAGSHSVTVTDAKDCTTNCSITITQPDVLSCSVIQDDPAKCYGDSNGKATVTPAGGNGEYTFAWDNGETSAQAVSLNAGVHIVTVTDKLGYTTTCNVTINQPEQALSAVKSQIDVTCGGGNTASATVTVSGGTSPYTYAWDTNPVQTSATANTLSAGNYSVIITDTKGCTITESFIILDGDAVKPIIAPLPETTTINCPEVPVFTEAAATDNNGTISSLTYEDTIVAGNCAGSYTKTRTWTAVDACGNISLPVSQVIIVQDITAPTWVTQAGSLNQTVECSNQEALASAQAQFPIAADNCDSDVSNIEKVSGQFMTSEGCSNTGTITNTWTAKDDCGNISGTFTQVITIQDKTAPVFIGNLPSDMTVSCDAVPQPAEMTASDNCNGDLPIVFTEVKSNIQEGCSSNYTLTRKWTTSDCGNNTVSYTQIITVRDTTPPTGTAPADVANLQNIASIPVASPSDIKDAADNCSANVNITVSDSNNGGSG